MNRFSKSASWLFITSVTAACLLLVGHCGIARVAADDEEKPTEKPDSAAPKDRAADKALFEKLDENEDGWLSGTEMSSVKSYDVDQNGRVTEIEFYAGQAKARLAKVKTGDTPAGGPPVAPSEVAPPAAPPGSNTKQPTAPPPAQGSPLLPVMGNLSTSQAVLMNRYLALLTTAFEKDVLSAKVTEEKVIEVARGMPALSQYLEAAKPVLSPTDRNFVGAIQELHQLLRTQSLQLVEYTKAKDEKQLAAVRAAEAAFETRFQKMMSDLSGGGGGGGGGSSGVSELDKTVNAIASDGNKLSEQVGAKFKVVFSDKSLSGLPGNREAIAKDSQEVADLLSKAAEKYREAAGLCEKESKKGTGDSRYWALKGRSFRRLAEAKEGFRALALLVQDETVTDKAVFESRAKPIVDEALELNAESQKLMKQSTDVWQQLHPSK